MASLARARTFYWYCTVVLYCTYQARAVSHIFGFDGPIHTSLNALVYGQKMSSRRLVNNWMTSAERILTLLLIIISSFNNGYSAAGLLLKLNLSMSDRNGYRKDDVQPKREGYARNISRRHWFQSFAILNAPAILSVTSTPEAAGAVGQNQAVYDLQFYLRDLLQGNNVQGNLPASKPPTPPAPPRTLTGPLIPFLLNNECTVTCIPAQELSKFLPTGSSSETASSNLVSDTMNMFRTNAIKAGYGSSRPWLSEDVSDEYYFDLTCYALWRTAASLLPSSTARDRFARNIGRALYNEMKRIHIVDNDEELNGNTRSDVTLISTKSSTQLSAAILPKLYSILNAFQSAQYIQSYRVTRDESYSLTDNEPLFDDIDDEDYYDKENSLNFLVGLYNPASIQAALQITGEGSRFIPDFVGCTIAAMLEDSVQATTVTYESYFVDPQYRPNPKDYFPNEQLLQFTFMKLR